jgi:hypothetical protein
MNKNLAQMLRVSAVVVITAVITYLVLERWDAIKAWLVRMFS